MPRINIYEHSETYSFQTKNNSYATVAFPIAAIWGPTYVEGDEDANPDWVHFSAGYRGTTDFMTTFRGANNYLGAREKSFDYALKLLASGYDILVKRVDGLGSCSYSDLFVVPAGTPTPEPASASVELQPSRNAEGSGKPDTYGELAYRLYLPLPTVVGGEAIWSYNYDGSNDLDMLGEIKGQAYNEKTGKWEQAWENTGFKITAREATGQKMIVAIEKPTIIATQIIDTKTTHLLKDERNTPITVNGKKVTLSGSVPISVYTEDGVLLERKNINITETSEYLGSSGHKHFYVEVNSTLSPEFTYINVLEVPPVLSLKAVYDPTSTNLYASNSADTAYGLFTIRLGAAWSEKPSNDIIYRTEGIATEIADTVQEVRLTAKYPGTFGNNLKVRIKCGTNADGFKIGTIEVFDNNGYQTNPRDIVSTDQLLELVSVAFDEEAATDNRPLITEATLSNLKTPTFTLRSSGSDVSPSDYPVGVQVVSLIYGTDYAPDIRNKNSKRNITKEDILDIVSERFDKEASYYIYLDKIAEQYEKDDKDALVRLYNQQMLYKRFYKCVDELTDPIVYDWDALVLGIADDQYVPKSYLDSNDEFTMEYEVSTLVTKMVEVAANSKCGAALIGTPFGMPRGIQTGTGANTVKTGALKYKDDLSQAVGTTYSTFGEVVGPWCKTTLALAGSNSWIAPEVAHLLLIINAKGVGGQNKWWMVPAGMMGTGIVHSPEYKIKKKYLDLIQDHDEGVCLNPLMEVPGKGFTCFGNSTLWDKPLGTYNALQNLSTRFLTNRVKQRIWDTALQILFRYNNEDAYSHFYAGLSPLLDEMRAVGALTGNEYNPWGYRIIMNPDIINLDRINANTVIGKVELAVTGVIDTVDVDLFLLPPTGFQETYD